MVEGKMVRVGKLGVHGFGCVCNLVMGQSVKVAIFEMSRNRISSRVYYIRLPQVAIWLPQYSTDTTSTGPDAYMQKAGDS